MGGKVLLADGEAARTACARVLVRGGTDEETGEALSAGVVAERVALVRGPGAGHGRRAAGRALERSATWRRSPRDGTRPGGRCRARRGWRCAASAGPPPSRAGVTVNDRITRMAQEQAGRVLRSACLAGCPDRARSSRRGPRDPAKRTPEEWDAVRGPRSPGGEHVAVRRDPGPHPPGRPVPARQGRLPAGVSELEAPAGRAAGCSCWRRATGSRPPSTARGRPGRALLRLQLPVRPDPRGYSDWSWVAVPLTLPPTVPAAAALHLPALRVTDGRLRADLAVHPPGPRRPGGTGTPSRSGWTGG